MATGAATTQPTGTKVPIKRRLFDVTVDEISLVDNPAVPDARILLAKRDVAPEVQSPEVVPGQPIDQSGSGDAPASEPQPIAKDATPPPTNDGSNTDGGMTPEQHVQTLLDMMGDLPEEACPHVVALAQAAGIEVPADYLAGDSTALFNSLPTHVRDAVKSVTEYFGPASGSKVPATADGGKGKNKKRRRRVAAAKRLTKLFQAGKLDPDEISRILHVEAATPAAITSPVTAPTTTGNFASQVGAALRKRQAESGSTKLVAAAASLLGRTEEIQKQVESITNRVNLACGHCD